MGLSQSQPIALGYDEPVNLQYWGYTDFLIDCHPSSSSYYLVLERGSEELGRVKTWNLSAIPIFLGGN